MSSRRVTCALLGGFVLAAAVSACGGQGRQDVTEPSGSFPVVVTSATFPLLQRLSQHSSLVIAVRNAGHSTIPDVAVTITEAGRGTAVQAFGAYNATPGAAFNSTAVWIVDRPPGKCSGRPGYACRSGGGGQSVTAYSNTWALGQLRPGATAVFRWALTAVLPGHFSVDWEVAAGLNGKAKARLVGGGPARGRFRVLISPKPKQEYVDAAGQIIQTQ